jgi:hypothetical protein
MFVAATLVGCTKSEINQVSGEGVEIALRSDLVDASGVVSRVPFEGDVSVANVLEARVVTSIAQNFSGTYANGVMKFNGEVAANYEKPLDAGTSSKFPTSTDPVYLYGVYPATGWTINNAVAEYAFTGNADVMVAGKISTTQQDVTDGTYKELRFKHALTRLEVKLSAASPEVAPALGDVTAIKLVGSDANSTTPVYNKVSANYASDPVSLTFSSSATSLNFYGLSLGADGKKAYTDTPLSAYALKSDPTLVAYSLVAPVDATTVATKEYFLEITTATGGVKRTIAVDLLKADSTPFTGSTAGRSFTVSINFKSTEQIAALAVVEDWDEQGEWKGEVAI